MHLVRQERICYRDRLTCTHGGQHADASFGAERQQLGLRVNVIDAIQYEVRGATQKSLGSIGPEADRRTDTEVTGSSDPSDVTTRYLNQNQTNTIC